MTFTFVIYIPSVMPHFPPSFLVEREGLLGTTSLISSSPSLLSSLPIGA